jgi:hypothetical protein
VQPLARLLGAVVPAVVLFALGVLFATLAVRELRNGAALADRGVVAEARAIEWQVLDGRDHQVRYELIVDAVTYSASDATGRTGLWSDVREADWQQSRETGTLAVRYLPERPWVNEPATGSPGSGGDHVGGLVLAVLCFGMAPVFGARAARGYFSR